MNDKAEKIYADAFFELCLEENKDGLSDILGELVKLSELLDEYPDFIKLLGTPTVSVDEKLVIMRELTAVGGVSELTANLVCVLTERGRMNCFDGIVKNFRILYNDYFKIAEITVTSSAPLSDEMKAKITEKMTQVTGKTVSLKEKTDPALIGGIVIDYGSTRYDGSVRTRLAQLKKELGGVIA